MEGRSPEIIIPNPTEEKTDDGFSEKRLARIIEGKKKDTTQVKKNLPVGRQGKSASVSARKTRLIQLVKKRRDQKKVISRRDKI